MADCPDPEARPHTMLTCSRPQCRQSAHPQCMQFSSELTKAVRRREDWLCYDCKVCAVCFEDTDDDKLAHCDDCDRAVHTFCATPRLRNVPRGRWSCASSTHACASTSLHSGSAVGKRASARTGGSSSSAAPRRRTRNHEGSSDIFDGSENEDEEEDEEEEEEEDDDDDDEYEEEDEDEDEEEDEDEDEEEEEEDDDNDEEQVEVGKADVREGSAVAAAAAAAAAEGDDADAIPEITTAPEDRICPEGLPPLSDDPDPDSASARAARAREENAALTDDDVMAMKPQYLRLIRVDGVLKIHNLQFGYCPYGPCHGLGHIKRYETHHTKGGCPLIEANGRSRPRTRKSRSRSRRGDGTRKRRRKSRGRSHRKSSRSHRRERTEPEEAAAPVPIDQDAWEPPANVVQTFVAADEDQELFAEAQAAAAEAAQRPEPAEGEDPPRLQKIELGGVEMETWYKSPYPEEFAAMEKMFICDFCLKFFSTYDALKRHMEKPTHVPHPPGDEIYRKGSLSVWEVDGKKNRVYCQNLCLLAKLFLDHKTLYYDVEPFLFYVLTEWQRDGAHLVGYFSKEKASFLQFNLSCIMVLPSHQRKSFGKLLIDFSYQLSKKEGKTGGPERPLSDLGLLSYRDYWKDVILESLREHDGESISIEQLSQSTSIQVHDLVNTLQALKLVKYWRGKHVILMRKELFQLQAKRRARPRVDPSALRWSPLVHTES